MHGKTMAPFHRSQSQPPHRTCLKSIIARSVHAVEGPNMHGHAIAFDYVVRGIGEISVKQAAREKAGTPLSGNETEPVLGCICGHNVNRISARAAMLSTIRTVLLRSINCG